MGKVFLDHDNSSITKKIPVDLAEKSLRNFCFEKLCIYMFDLFANKGKVEKME